MYPGLVAQAVSTIANMSRANYFYIIAYPEYSGYKVEHDPTFTAYIATESSAEPTPQGTPNLQGLGGLIIILVIVIVVGVAVAVFVARRKS
jgi:subtilase family serine protease